MDLETPKKRHIDPALKDVIRKIPRDPQAVARQSIYITTGAISAVAFVLCLLTAFDVMPWHKKFMTDWFLVSLFVGAGPVAFFYSKDAKRVEEADSRFPDFLRDLAESARAGMTLPRAMVTAGQSNYGALTPDIKKMAAQVEWGVDFTETLGRYARTSKSQLIKRIISLIIEARHAGGNVVDVLTAASEDARQIKQIVETRNAQMSTYGIVIYVTFFVFVAVVLILQAQFIPAFADAVEAAGGGVQVGGLQFNPFDPEDFRTLFFHAAIVQAIGGGLVGGVLMRGHPIAGLKGIIIMLSAAWFAFRVVV